MIMVNGIPAHPLVIHAVVVLLPLATLGTIAMAIRPRWRRALGIPVALVALAGGIAVPIATQTGEQLQRALNGAGRSSRSTSRGRRACSLGRSPSSSW
jgi:hypothetical protein